MTDLEIQASKLADRAEKATHAERMMLQPQIDRVLSTLAMRGAPVSGRLRRINNTLKDEALDDMFDNMPV
ncbi:MULTISPECIES: hypothetical protein [Roseobacter]|uniref:hypothetical protein n=1 Tax=Roseobacter TaxID=2433 RepID=UPI000160EA42|nr:MULTISPECIES: hypothetical protein [Roseobacter]GIT89114.1 hypothetical protein ROBYS_41300 [Roseobacter sp. OBYS 0001]